jgi:peptidoglycan/xylan/chitin deacetylase (PgdA/CDA1 family)
MKINSQKTTYFIVSVDTETYAVNGTPPPFGANLYGEIGGELLGVPKIMDICDRFGAKGTFFVDVYMHRYYGEKQCAEFCQSIHQRGHDVQLHAHMSWLPNSKADGLSAYSRDQQTEFLAEGKELIRRWIGRAPRAFRAGSYAANLDTIQALRENGFVVDSSYFAHNPRCQLSQQLENRFANKLFKIDGVYEVPVTTYWLLNLPGYRKIGKMDVNSSAFAELKNIAWKLLDSEIEYVVLFLHSFSFIRWKKDGSGIVPNYRAVRRFENLMREIAGSGRRVAFCTFEDLCRELPGRPCEDPDYLPTLNFWRVPARAVQRILE